MDDVDSALTRLQAAVDALSQEVVMQGVKVVRGGADVSLRQAYKGKFLAAKSTITQVGMFADVRDEDSGALMKQVVGDVARSNVDSLANLMRVARGTGHPEQAVQAHQLVLDTVGAFNTAVPSDVTIKIANEGAMTQFQISQARKPKLAR